MESRALRRRGLTAGRSVLATVLISMVLLVVAEAPGHAVPAPLAAYGFEEGVGTTAFDATANGHDGTIDVSNLWAVGHTGTGVFNDATAGGTPSDGVQMARAGLEPSSAISVVAWVYMSDWTATSWSTAVTKGLASVGDSATLYGLAGTNRPGFNVTTANNSNAMAYGPQNLSVGWHHLAGTYDGSNVRMYVDGVLSQTTPATGALQYDTSDWSMLRSYVWSESLEGGVDDVRIFDVAISGTDVATFMSTPVGIIDTETVTVTAVVDPFLSFVVSGYNAGSCNGAAISSTDSTGTSVRLRPTTGANSIGGQTLTVSSNAGNGYTLYARYAGALSDGQGHSIADWTGTNASPTSFSAPGTAAFGYTTDHDLSGTATRFQSDKWAKFTTGNNEVAYEAVGPIDNDATHVCVQAGLSGTEAAGVYTTTVVYTVVPVF